MLLVKVTLQPSPIHGLGIFAAEDIAQGQIAWRFDPRIDPLIPQEEVTSLPEGVQEFLYTYGYVTEMHGRRWVLLCGDHAKHTNHADHPNLGETEDQGLPAEVALRDIAAGEELTCNYYDFDLEADYDYH